MQVLLLLNLLSVAIAAQSWNRRTNGKLKFPQSVSFKSQSFQSFSNQQQICSCSRPVEEFQFRIMGGKPVNPHDYPEMVLVVVNRTTGCGGTVLNRQYILTAAHCVINSDASVIIVLAGSHDLNAFEPSRKTLKVQRIIHSGFNRKTLENDFALLELAEYLSFNSAIQPTCIPLTIKNYIGNPAIAIGWGMTSEYDAMSPLLNEVAISIISNTDCQSSFSGRRIYHSMMCAGVKEGGKDTCGGDSGGPLFIRDGFGLLNQVGITSFGAGCGRPGIPGVYTRIDYMINFILQNVNINGCKIYTNNF